MKIYLVFDGTSHFIVPQDEYTDDLELISIFGESEMYEANKKVEELNNRYCKG